MFEFTPDAERLSQMFQNATSPTFFLGAVAAFASLMTARSNAVLARIQLLNAIPETDETRAPLKTDIQRLFRRAAHPAEWHQSVVMRSYMHHDTAGNHVCNRLLGV